MKKIEIIISFPFFALVTIMCTEKMSLSLIHALIFSVFHEFGHLIALLIFGVLPEKVKIGIFGIKLELDDNILSYKYECVIALCGPAINLIFAVIFGFLNNGEIIRNVNLGLFAANMMPFSILDGGRFIFNFLMMFFDYDKTDRICNFLQLVAGIILVFVCIMLIVMKNINYTFLIFCSVIIIDKLCCILFKKSV